MSGFLVVGLVMIWFALLDLAVRCGPTLDAQVTSNFTTHTKAPTYHLRYRFTYAGELHAGEDEVDAATYQSHSPGHTIRIHAAALGGDVNSQIDTSNIDYLSKALGSMFLFGIWCTVFCTQSYRMWKVRWLLKFGTAVQGVLLTREQLNATRKSAEYSYFYRPLNGKSYVSRQSLSGTSASRNLVEHQTVTVLYDPKRPRWSTIYELADLACVGVKL